MDGGSGLGHGVIAAWFMEKAEWLEDTALSGGEMRGGERGERVPSNFSFCGKERPGGF